MVFRDHSEHTGQIPGWATAPNAGRTARAKTSLSEHELNSFKQLVKKNASVPWLTCLLAVSSWLESKELAKSIRYKLRILARAVYVEEAGKIKQAKTMRKAGGKYTAKDKGDDGKVRYKYRKPKMGEIPEGQQALTKRLRDKLQAIIDRSGHDGFDYKLLVPFLKEFSQDEVITALKELGHVSITGDKVFVAPYIVPETKKSLPTPKAFVRITLPHRLWKGHVDKLPGGAADDKDPSEFDPEALAEGAQHESEHTIDPDIAEEIAMDHLTEDPQYYTKLKKIEKAGLPLPGPSLNSGSAISAQHSAGATGHTSTVPMEVGARRIWGDRILEKKPDGKWHLVGHVGGLEGEAVPNKKHKEGRDGIPLEIRSLTKEQAQFLIDALKDAKEAGVKEGKAEKKDKKKD